VGVEGEGGEGEVVGEGFDGGDEGSWRRDGEGVAHRGGVAV